MLYAATFMLARAPKKPPLPNSLCCLFSPHNLSLTLLCQCLVGIYL